jgi:hypothetical protein
MSGAEDLPPGWTEHIDEETKIPYFFHSGRSYNPPSTPHPKTCTYSRSKGLFEPATHASMF